MKLFMVISVLSVALAAMADEGKPTPFEPTWASLERYEAPAWYRDAKFGIFVHWGPQTLAGSRGSSDGTKSPWKELAGQFKGEKFDAAGCAALFRQAGAKYVVQVVEHHDAYALYDSSHTEWSSVKMPPKRDFAAELSTAVRREGLVYGASSHTEENWWFYSDPPKKLPPLPKAGEAPKGEQPPKEWLDQWYARLVEIVEKYDPQVFWFDWSIEQPAYEPYLRKFAAYYYNRARERHHEVVLNYKYEAFPVHAAVLDVSVGTGKLSWAPEGVHESPWQFDTWSAKGLWFWRPTMQIRPTSALIAEMVDVVSKNGNYLLNVTPDPDGVISPEQVKMLSEIGQWMKTNGEAVYGTRPWAVYGEGPTAGIGPSFKPDVPKEAYTAKDVRFTSKVDAVYATVLAWPADGRVVIREMSKGSDRMKKDVAGVTLLGAGAVRFERTSDGLVVDVGGQQPTGLPLVLKVEAR